MRNLFLITVALLLSSLYCVAADDHNSDWQKANNYYQQKQYDSAVFFYEQIAALKPLNADLYYNLGNAYYRLNKIGFAVLNYERALKINPEYKVASDNLVLAQNRIANHIPEVPDIFFVRWWESVTKAGNATAWAATSFATFILFIGLLLLRLLKKSKAPIQLYGTLFFVLLCCLTLAYFSTKHSIKNTAAVVMEGDVPMMNNSLSGKPLTLVPEGTVIKIKEEKGDWIQVRLPDGRSGWLKQKVVVKI